MWMLGVALAMEPPEEPEEVEDKQPWERTGWGFGGLPAINYNSDEGFGFGVVGSLYKYDGETGPYKTAFNLVLFATTKAVQTHTLEVDWLEVRGAPVRLTVRGEFASTSTSNYCGTGPDVTCDPALAEAAADQAELTGEAREDFVRRYYRARFLNPNLRADVRWALDPMPHRVELLLGYRANAMIPGDFQDKEPWPGSLYAQDFPGGEGGLVSVLQAGVVLDDRDNEPAPIRGYWIEGSLRAASFLLGSDYDYVGFNATLRGYVPLGTDRLVLADRLMLDGLVGDAHTLELTTPGGTQRIPFYGSLNAGRGIRQRRYVGKSKLLEQVELRWTFWSPVVAGVQLDLGMLGFADVGFVGEELPDFGRSLQKPLPGTGGGLRIALDKNFVVRADVGVSPIEDWAPSVYIDLRNLF
jgi:hypothetical protein